MDGIPGTAVYWTEELADELGQGIRIYCSDGSLYEARRAGETESRIYRENDSWHVKIGEAVDSTEEGYAVMHTMAERIDDEAGTSFVDDVEAAYAEDEAFDDAWYEHSGMGLRHDTEHQVEFPGVDLPKLKFYESWNLGYGTGLLANILLAGGAISGPFAAAGAALSFVGGTAAPHIGEYVGEKWKERKYSSGDVVQDDDLFTKLSEQDYLSRRNMEADISSAEYERLEELRDQELEATWDTIRDIQFESFERLEGVAAWNEADSYQDAAGFAATMLDTAADLEEPSFLEDPDAFDAMMEYMEEGKKVQMVWTALEEEPDEEMEALLDEEYGAYIEQVMERELRNGM